MRRNIYEVYAKVVDANGAYNTLTGYPKVFDSKSYSGDIEKTRQRAYGEYHETIGAMCKRDDRQLQLVMLIDAGSGLMIECSVLGEIAEVAEPRDEEAE